VGGVVICRCSEINRTIVWEPMNRMIREMGVGQVLNRVDTWFVTVPVMWGLVREEHGG
jgi:hypothetical protein